MSTFLKRFSNSEWAILLTVVALLLAGYSEAASVYSCTSSGERCVVKVEDGMVGDRVKILDDKARPIASGRILKKKGAYALVSVNGASQTVRKGYPVIISPDNRSSNMQWASSFTGQD